MKFVIEASKEYGWRGDFLSALNSQQYDLVVIARRFASVTDDLIACGRGSISDDWHYYTPYLPRSDPLK